MANIANQFTGLPIENLIAAPLLAAAEGQKSLASTTASFITEVGMDDKGNTKSVTFNYEDGSKDVKLIDELREEEEKLIATRTTTKEEE